MHPSAPDDLPGLLEAYDQCVQAVIDLGWSCREADFAAATECPGWTVKDQISHVVGLEKTFAGIHREPIDVPDYDHVLTDLARAVEVDVEARRSWPGRDVVTELADFHAERMEQLQVTGRGVDEVVGGAFGPDTTFGQQLRSRILDVWVHEQDIRAALDRPGDLDSAGAATFTGAVLEALPRIAARVARIEPGHAIVLDVTGPIVAREGARVTNGEDGRPYGELLFSGHDRPIGDEQLDVTTIQLTTDALTRRAAGRRSTDQIRYTVIGDEQVARRLLDAIVITS